MSFRAFITIFVVSTLPLQASAETLTGHVVGVTDGDTITLLDASTSQHKIRLAGIDAPEKKQAFGQRSKEFLSDLAYDKDLSIEWSKKDRYGRIVGKLIDKRGRDLNLEQVKAGLAWHYRKYEKEQSPEDRKRYAAAEDVARGKRIGVWSDAAPVAPWDFRKMKREGAE